MPGSRPSWRPSTTSPGGIIFKLHAGAQVRFTQRRINDEVWMADRWYARARAKRVLVFGFHREYSASYGNLRRFTADSTEVHASPLALDP